MSLVPSQPTIKERIAACTDAGEAQTTANNWLDKAIDLEAKRSAGSMSAPNAVMERALQTACDWENRAYELRRAT